MNHGRELSCMKKFRGKVKDKLRPKIDTFVPPKNFNEKGNHVLFRVYRFVGVIPSGCFQRPESVNRVPWFFANLDPSNLRSKAT